MSCFDGIHTRLRQLMEGHAKLLENADRLRSSSLKQSLLRLTSEPRDEIEENGKHNANHDRCSKWEEDRDILATVGDVTGQPSKRPSESPGNHQRCSHYDQQQPETEKRFSNFNHGAWRCLTQLGYGNRALRNQPTRSAPPEGVNASRHDAARHPMFTGGAA